MEKKEKEISEMEQTIAAIRQRTEEEKEEKIVNLIVTLIVSSTLEEYYEASNKIPEI